jgi:hypothetical protein
MPVGAPSGLARWPIGNADTMRAPPIEEQVIRLETEVREKSHDVVALFIKPQTPKALENHLERSRGQGPPQWTATNGARAAKAAI